MRVDAVAAAFICTVRSMYSAMSGLLVDSTLSRSLSGCPSQKATLFDLGRGAIDLFRDSETRHIDILGHLKPWSLLAARRERLRP